MQKELSYERDLNQCSMILSSADIEENFIGKMILQNDIPHFLKAYREEGEKGCRYDITSKISLTEYLEHSYIRLPFCKQLIFTLCNAIDTLEEYLLSEKNLYLVPETIYLTREDTEQPQFFFTVTPEEDSQIRGQLNDLIQYLMKKTDPEEDGEVSSARLLYLLYERLQKNNFCVKEFRCVLEDFSDQKKEEVPSGRRLVKNPKASSKSLMQISKKPVRWFPFRYTVR